MSVDVNQLLVNRFAQELDQDRVLTSDMLAREQDSVMQQKVASALVQRYQLSPNWSQRHKIYPTVERDQLAALLEDSLHRLHSLDFKAESDEVSRRLSEPGLELDEERALLAHKMQLDRKIQTVMAHFGTAVFPT